MSASSSLTPNGLCILLFLRSDPDSYHWALYHHHNEAKGRTKHHIANVGRNGNWIADYGPVKDISKSMFLAGLFQIATIPHEFECCVDHVFRSLDDNLDVPDTTCRSWLFKILSLKVQGNNIVEYDDLDALEEEVKAFGKEHRASAEMHVQPRPVGQSSKYYTRPTGSADPLTVNKGTSSCGAGLSSRQRVSHRIHWRRTRDFSWIRI
jgi:hypothetical protein